MQDGVAATRLSLAEIPSDTLRRMHEYWQGRCRGEQLPGRQDIDPLDFPWALGLVCLLDVERYPLAFRYRLDGTTIAERYGGQARTYLRLALPLARDGKTVDMIMTISDRLAPDYEDDVGSDQLFR